MSKFEQFIDIGKHIVRMNWQAGTPSSTLVVHYTQLIKEELKLQHTEYAKFVEELLRFQEGYVFYNKKARQSSMYDIVTDCKNLNSTLFSLLVEHRVLKLPLAA